MPAMGQTTKPLVAVPKSAADSECWRWLGTLDENGRGSKTYCGQTMTAARWLWLTLFGPLPEDFIVSNTCGNRWCANPAHLIAWVVADANREVRATLLPGDVADIRRRKENRTGAEASLLAARYGVDVSSIYKIWSGRSWRRTPRRMTAITTNTAA